MYLAEIKMGEAFDFVMHFRNMFYHLAVFGCMLRLLVKRRSWMKANWVNCVSEPMNNDSSMNTTTQTTDSTRYFDFWATVTLSAYSY